MQTRPAQIARLWELVRLFLKLGVIGFGGPAAHIALMDEEVVRRRGWLSREEFLDLLGATNLIPGPNSTEMAIHIGFRRAGWPGLLVAGSCFILPAMLLVMACGWAYVSYGSLPQIAGLLYGGKPVIIAVVLQALWGLGQSALKINLPGRKPRPDWPLLGIAVAAAVLASVRVNELALLLGAGLLGAAARWFSPAAGRAASALGLATLPFAGTAAKAQVLPAPGVAALTLTAPAAAATAAAVPYSLWTLLFFFLKVGSVLYGSGYVLLAFLRSGLVERFGWLTESQLLDAVAVGQITPGPVFTTATFVGYLVGGAPGATVATIGIFAPAFVFVALSEPLMPRIRRSPTAGAFLDGVNSASLALMAVVTFQLGRAAIVDWITLGLFLISAVLLVRFKTGSVWLILAGAVAGWVRSSVL